MYAIIDIETTGGNPKKDRITEIAIFIHNGYRVIEEYCTLVNPGVAISPFITALTGISNEMVAEAPAWPEVSEKINELTKGRVFVAHNVRFDYTFVANEYKRMGQRYQRKQLCTVRLSRTLLPGLQSYSLGRLCVQVGIPIAHRHRAFGDGAATAELFNVLLQHDGQKIISRALKDEISQSLMPPNLRREHLEELPEDTGIYYFRDERGKILYIGKSTNIRQRVIGHFSGDMNHAKYQGLKSRLHSIDFELTGNELVALLKESHEIKRWMPPFNTSQKRKKYRYGVYQDHDEEGYVRLGCHLIRMEGEPLVMVKTRRGAYEILGRLAEENSLCLKKCDMANADDTESCTCLGACSGGEDVESYNRRVKKALQKYQYEKPDFVIIGEGRSPQERSVVCVENGQFLGYTFLEQPDDESYSYDQLKDMVKPVNDHPDFHSIIRSFIKRKKKGNLVMYR